METVNTLATSRSLRDAGLALIEQARRDWLQEARAKAAAIAKETGTVTINDLRRVLVLPEGWSPNTWGAIFHCKQFKAVSVGQAQHPAAHARLIRIYQLNDESTQ